MEYGTLFAWNNSPWSLEGGEGFLGTYWAELMYEGEPLHMWKFDYEFELGEFLAEIAHIFPDSDGGLTIRDQKYIVPVEEKRAP